MHEHDPRPAKDTDHTFQGWDHHDPERVVREALAVLILKELRRERHHRKQTERSHAGIGIHPLKLVGYVAGYGAATALALGVGLQRHRAARQQAL